MMNSLRMRALTAGSQPSHSLPSPTVPPVSSSSESCAPVAAPATALTAVPSASPLRIPVTNMDVSEAAQALCDLIPRTPPTSMMKRGRQTGDGTPVSEASMKRSSRDADSGLMSWPIQGSSPAECADVAGAADVSATSPTLLSSSSACKPLSGHIFQTIDALGFSKLHCRALLKLAAAKLASFPPTPEQEELVARLEVRRVSWSVHHFHPLQALCAHTIGFVRVVLRAPGSDAGCWQVATPHKA